MKKLFAAMLVLAILFSLAACQIGKETIVGSWVCKFDLGSIMNEKLGESVGEELEIPSTSANMNIVFDFTEDGRLTLSMEIDAESVGKYMEEMADSVIDYLYKVGEGSGLTKEQMESSFETAYGKSLEAYVDEILEEAKESMVNEMDVEKTSFYYMLDEGSGLIYIGSSTKELEEASTYMEYAMEGNQLTIKSFMQNGEELDAFDSLEEFGFNLPWIFEKK